MCKQKQLTQATYQYWKILYSCTLQQKEMLFKSVHFSRLPWVIDSGPGTSGHVHVLLTLALPHPEGQPNNYE